MLGNVTVDAVWSQDPVGQDKSFAYASRNSNNAEQNYSIIENKFLVIVFI